MITESYVLMTRIPLFIDGTGRVLADTLWAKDIQEHLKYIADLRICCPLEPVGTGADLVPVDIPREGIIPLRRDRGWGSVASNLIPNYFAVRRAAKSSEIVHSSAAGWAFPLSYYLLLIRPFYRFHWIEVVESSFWMSDETNAGIRTRIAEPLHRWLVRACLRMADARIFTQDWYREVLFGRHDASLIAPASWIDPATIRHQPWQRQPGPVRLIFPTRLIEQKGVRTVLEAIDLYGKSDGPEIVIDIVGAGPMLDEIREICRAHGGGQVSLRLLPPVPYGPEFFQLLRGYDAVIIAAVSQEQPRIAFDAFSQGIPCLASNTNGNRSVVTDEITGMLFSAGDPAALAAVLRLVAGDPDKLTAMGASALDVAKAHTHEQMHRDRERFLAATLQLREAS